MTVDLLRNTVVMSGAQERINGEATLSETIRLSDNMPSIRKILFNTESALIKSAESYLGGVSIKGEVTCSVVYLGENGATDAISAVLPFEFLRETQFRGSGSIHARCRVIHSEILPMKQRRVDLNCTVAFEGVCAEETTLEALAAVDGVEGMNYLRDEREASLIFAKNTLKDISYSFSAGAVTPGKILACQAYLSEVATNSSSSGVLVNGMLNQYVLYTTVDEEDSVTYHASHESFAVNQFIETEFGSSFDSYEASCEAVMGEARFEVNEAGEYDIETSGTMSCSLLLAKKVSYSAVCDLYSTDKRLEIKNREVPILKGIALRNETRQVTLTQKLSSDGFSKIALPGSRVTCQVRHEEDVVTVTGEATFDVALLKNTGGETECASLTSEFHFEVQTGPGHQVVASPEISSASFDVNGDELTVRAEISCPMIVIWPGVEYEPTDAQVSEYESGEDNYVTVKVRYINENENIWTLAKENRTSIAHILASNNLDSEESIRPSKPLIIRNF